MGLQGCWKVATGFYRCRDKAHTDAEFDVRHELNRLPGLLRYCDALVNGLGYTEFGIRDNIPNTGRY